MAETPTTIPDAADVTTPVNLDATPPPQRTRVGWFADRRVGLRRHALPDQRGDLGRRRNGQPAEQVPETEGTHSGHGDRIRDHPRPERRELTGLAMGLSVAENTAFPMTCRAEHKLRRFRRAQQKAVVADWMERLAVRPRAPQALVKTLSGGNQQMVLPAKWLAKAPTLFLLHAPTAPGVADPTPTKQGEAQFS